MVLKDKLYNKMKIFSNTIVVLLFVFLNLSIDLCAQQRVLKFKHLTTENGLSNSDVNCITQDKNGFIWIGTADGLNRFDGYTIKIYRHDHKNPTSLSNNIIYSLFVDIDGDLWIGTENGLCMYNGEKDAFINYYNEVNNVSSISSNRITCITGDKNKRIWIATEGDGLNCFDKKNKAVTRYFWNANNIDSQRLNSIKTVICDKENNIWVGTLVGIGFYNPEEKQFIQYKPDSKSKNSLSDSTIYSICQDKDGKIWIGTWNGGLNLFDKQKNIFVRYEANYVDNHVKSIYLDSKGNLWVGVRGGLKSYDRNRNVFYLNSPNENDDYSLLDENVSCIFEDFHGGLWFGHTNAGVSYLTVNKKFETYSITRKGGRNVRNVSSILEDKNKNLWIGYFVGGIDVIDRKNYNIIHHKPDPNDQNSIGSGTVFSIFEDKQNDIWIGTYSGGLSLYDKEKGIFKHYKHNPYDPNSIGGNDVRYIIEDKQGNLWLAIHGGGINMFDRKNNVFHRYLADVNNINSISSDWVWPVYEDHTKGNIWVGTVLGLSMLNRSNMMFESYSHDENDLYSLSNNTINTIFEDSRENLWIGTKDGLNLFNRDKQNFTQYHVSDGLPNDVINGVLEDDQGNLWISTNKGISKFNFQNKTFRNYDKVDGLQGNEFSARACYKSINGEMFFGGGNGFNFFYPDSIKDNLFIPHVAITNLLLFNQPIQVGKNRDGRILLEKSIIETDAIDLSYKDYVISFEYTGLQYNSPGKNQYAYMLEGFDKGWNYVGNKHTATYTNLDPGEYVFRVRASNNDGIWNEKGKSIRIVIRPPFWKTWWFKIISSLILIMSLLGVYESRLHRMRKQRENLELLVRDRTKDLSIANQELEVQKAHIHQHAEALKRSNEELEQFAYVASHDLQEPLRMVSSYLRLLERRYKDKLDSDAREFIHFATDGAKRMQQLINDLLSYARITTQGKLFEPTDCEEIMGRVLQSLKMTIEENGGKVTHDALPTVMADGIQIERLIQNLVGNGLKYRGERAPEVHLSATRKNQEWVFSVRDNGIGIAPEYYEKIFGIFQRLHTREEYSGTGIGLAECKKIVERHGGRIWVESGSGEGSVFYFAIPVDNYN